MWRELNLSEFIELLFRIADALFKSNSHNPYNIHTLYNTEITMTINSNNL